MNLPAISPNPFRRPSVVAALLSAALTPMAFAEPAAGPTEVSSPPWKLRVMVTADGLPVTGIGREDVRLTWKGEDVAIDTWEEVTPDRATDRATGRAIQLRGLVFIDEAFALPGERNRALADLRRALTALSPTERAAVTLAIAAFDGQRVELLSPWTSSIEQLLGALDGAVGRPAFGLLRESERRRRIALSRPANRPPDAGSFSGTGFAGSRLPSVVEPEADSALLRRHARRSARAAAFTLEALAGGQGGALLLLGGGWLPPSSPAAECETLIEPLLVALARFGFAAYPVDLASPIAAGSETADGLLLRLAELSGGLFTENRPAAAFRHALTDAHHLYRVGFTLPTVLDSTGGESRIELTDPAFAGRITVRTVAFPTAPAPGSPPEGRFPLLLPTDQTPHGTWRTIVEGTQ